ncbi:glycoside hydrolase superfamily [Durotheca rogersii]|uniref:glycoside hydrolase superfamily n=1 Tax=Durotheca rogersii TaxID=419775 RepID=UPI002220C5D1|nr:glycoside hydrolase superfamily [Durotheca rogersii]KAI5859516.1 glycoside hydrolase superfamily [Durotheca rogersii]
MGDRTRAAAISLVAVWAALLTCMNIAAAAAVSGVASDSPTSCSPKTVTETAYLSSTIQVKSGSSCDSLTSDCGISAADFLTYNPDSKLCSTLMPGQYVCCSPGSLPDLTPKPDADGYCHTYTIMANDSCSAIASANSLASDDIEKFNAKTWGWSGCDRLYADTIICVSDGHPPMPAILPNAVCGPQVNGTTKVPPETDLATLNPCPLKACCDTWGQCGVTAEFCTPSNSSTGAPGTVVPNENGCISNCGTQIVSSDPPCETYSIAYYEAFGKTRPCLHMPVTSINASTYTHIHFSFITLNGDFSVNIGDFGDQLSAFKNMTGVKKVVSIGGWDFSTNPSTYKIFRDATNTQSARQTLITNVVKFLDDYGLDGIDWDWEYPGEPDIPGIPAGNATEGGDLLSLLKELRQKMPKEKTISIALPATFWYLKNFPLVELGRVVDYVVYMTYDLHTQGDYGDKWASPGCPSFEQGLGNCLRSHVNLTETKTALSLITKAGVPSNKVVVGVSSYGRSFVMTAADCWTEQCTFAGPDAGGYAGPCTNTPGYLSDYEIGQIVDGNPSAHKYWDESSHSDIVVFNDTQWVAYMDAKTKSDRRDMYLGLGFRGTADWAVDLQSE